jgi:hypothetical protein
MGNLTSALQQLRAERRVAQLQVEKLDQAISVIESLDGLASRNANQPTRIISAASRRKMAQAQRARWARARKESHPVITIAKTTGFAPTKRTHVSSSSQEDRGVSAGEVGEVEGTEGQARRPPSLSHNMIASHAGMLPRTSRATCSAAAVQILSAMSMRRISTVTGLFTISTGPSLSHSEAGKIKVNTRA